MTLIYKPDHPEANSNGMVDRKLLYATSDDPHFYVISDTMEPTRHMATNRMHTSKSEFRKDTKASGCIEYGNELPTLTKPRKQVVMDRGKRRDDIRKAIYDLRNNRHYRMGD